MIKSWILEKYVNERIEDNIRELCRDDEGYRAVCAELGDLTKEVCKHIDSLKEADREVFDKYNEVRDRETFLQNQYMYLAGIKDTLVFLKALDVIEGD